MTPEQIVRALAGADPAQRTGAWCGLCGTVLIAQPGDEAKRDHEPDCPWRLAVEWVAEQKTGPQLVNASRNPRDPGSWLDVHPGPRCGCEECISAQPGGTIEG